MLAWHYWAEAAGLAAALVTAPGGAAWWLRAWVPYPTSGATSSVGLGDGTWLTADDTMLHPWTVA
jgi:hypothetical protein